MPIKLLYTFLFYFVILTAQGNVLAVYEHKHAEGESGTFTLAEQHLYGASRIGMTKSNLALNTTTPDAASPTIHYELTNHLGNVMAVITDEPAATETPAVESLADYYPFGMTMPGRSYNAHTYRHGFTGHEKESDLSEGIYTTQYRLYDARVGRRLSVDPLFEKYVGMSPYNYCAGNPVKLVDVDGRDYNLNIDDENKTITITATYYTTTADLPSAHQVVDYWNNQSGKYIYRIKNRKDKSNAKDYSINFKLEAISVGDANERDKKIRQIGQRVNQDKSKSSNSYILLPDNKMDVNKNGHARGGNVIEIKDAKQNELTGAHEVGHTLGLTHSIYGLMTPSASDPNRTHEIGSDDLENMISYPLKGKTNSENGNVAGKGTLNPNSQIINLKEYEGYVIQNNKNY